MITHQNQWNFLVKSAELGKLPHALLFFGQEHLGKKTFAIEFAKFFIGKEIEKGTNPDFILVEPIGKEIQISQIRSLIERLSFKPYSADFKIAVIDNAHLMTQEAQNCFLKFLEEPKAKTLLILITEYPFLLLPTILSRTQKIRFYSSQKKEISPQFSSDLDKIVQSDLAGRFQYAKDLAEQNLEEVLDNWLRYFRKILVSRLMGKNLEEFGGYSLSKLKDIIRQIQSTKFLLSTTNINSRLALEILLMKL